MRADIRSRHDGVGASELTSKVPKPVEKFLAREEPLRDPALDRDDGAHEARAREARNRLDGARNWVKVCESLLLQWQDQRAIEVQEDRRTSRPQISRHSDLTLSIRFDATG